MANQPKKYKKFVATAATATLVASAIVPVASAKSFNDVADNNDHKANIDKISDLGYMGTGDNFNPGGNLTRGQVAIILANWAKDAAGKEVPADYKTAQRFEDVELTADDKLLQSAALVFDNEIFSGSNGNLLPANDITRLQMALVLNKAYKAIYGVTLVELAGDTSDVEIGDLDLIPAEHQGVVKALKKLNITAPANFNPNGKVTRGQFATFFIKTIEAKATDLAVKSVSAVSTKKLAVEFSAPVDTTKAQFEVKKGSVKINTSAITWNESKTVATIELSGKLTKGEYTVNVSELTEEVLTGSVQVEDERVAKIEVLSTEAPLVDAAAGIDADTDVDDLQVGYRVLNQYGEDITKTTSVTTSAANVHADPTTGTVTVVGNFDTNINKLATFTLIHAQSATTATATLTAVSSSVVSEVAIKGLYNKDGKTLTETTNLSSDLFYVELELKDQYGNAITNSAKLGEVLVTESNPTVVDAAPSASVIEVDGKNKVVVALTGSPAVGSNIVTVIAKATGKSASYTVSVAESARAYNVDVAAPALAVANEVTKIPVIVTDKDGNLITDLDVLKNGTRGVSISVDGTAGQESNLAVDKEGNVYLPVTFSSAGYKSIVISSKATHKVDTLTVEVKAKAKPVIITGIDSDFSTTIKAGDSVSIGAGDLVIEDQYGRVMTEDAVNAWLNDTTDTANAIVFTEDTATATISVDTDGQYEINTSADEVTVTADTANGTEKLSVALVDSNGTITSSVKDITLRVTDGTEYKSYEVKAIDTVYDEKGANSANSDDDSYDAEVKVFGVLADGSKVQLTHGTDFSVTSTNATINSDVTADGKLDVATALSYADGETTVVIPVTVTINATGDQFTQDVTFSKAKPKVNSVIVAADDETYSAAITTVEYDIDANSADFSIAELVTGADEDYNVIVTDQYGVAVLAAADGTITFPDSTTIAAPTLTIKPVKGSVTISGNGTANATVADSSLAAGEEFNVTLTYAGGKSVTVKVVAK